MKEEQAPPPEEPTPITLKPSTYQPNKVEQEETQDMPEWSLEGVRARFFQPFRVKSERNDLSSWGLLIVALIIGILVGVAWVIVRVALP